MNFNTVNRTTSKEVRDVIECVAGQRSWTLTFVGSPERRLELARERVARARENLEREERELARMEGLVVDCTTVVDAFDKRLHDLREILKWVNAKEQIQKLKRWNEEIAALESEGVSAGDPDAIEEEMIVS